MPILMCNVAWMKDYQGISDTDYPINGGAYIAENGYGHEVLNFEKNGLYVYGYVQAKNGTINIDRLGANGADYIDNVLVVWRARSSRGSVVIGWYKNARVYRNQQIGNSKRTFVYNDEPHYPGFLIRAKAPDAFLVPVHHRNFPVPVTHKGFGSQTFVSFLGRDDIDEVAQFKADLKIYIENAEAGHFAPQRRGQRGTIDIETKQKIEKNAIDTAVEFYVDLGYEVNSVESENIGYDLIAKSGREILNIEVKGTSAQSTQDVCVTLTPNEYKTSNRSKNKYRICIVINALKEPTLFEFAWDKHNQCWFSEQSLSKLKVAELISANLLFDTTKERERLKTSSRGAT